jgi:hypothetical protein
VRHGDALIEPAATARQADLGSRLTKPSPD